jgi:hypothetical protein
LTRIVSDPRRQAQYCAEGVNQFATARSKPSTALASLSPRSAAHATWPSGRMRNASAGDLWHDVSIRSGVDYLPAEPLRRRLELLARCSRRIVAIACSHRRGHIQDTRYRLIPAQSELERMQQAAIVCVCRCV